MVDYSGSRLQRMEAIVNEITKGVYKVSLRSVKHKSAMTAAKHIEKNPAYAKPFGMWVQSQLEEGSKEHSITAASLVTWWGSGSKFAEALYSHWKTPFDFLVDLGGAANEWADSKRKEDVTRSEKNSEASRAIIDTRETKTKEYPLYTNWSTVDEKISKPDIEFLYDRLSKDATNNLYWTFNNGVTVPIPMVEGSAARRIMDDANFWSAFALDNLSKIFDYTKYIVDRCYELRNDVGYDTADEELDSIESKLEEFVPHCISRNISIQIFFVKIGSGKDAHWAFDHFGLAMNAPKPAMNKTNWCAVLQVDMLRFLDFGRIKLIKQWSTNPDERAIHSFDMYNLKLGRRPSSLPTLPKKFSEFFNGKLVNPKMDMLRIATFVTSVIDPNNYSRQALLLVGLGKEGKGVLCRVFEHIFGSASVTLQEDAFDRERQFGLWPAINKRLVILQDVLRPTTLIETPKFKSLTGNDTLSIDRKYMNTMEWQVDGTKVIIVTNKRVWLNNNYAITRVLPVFFMKNYKSVNVAGLRTITRDLCKESNAFLQWCYDYVNYFKLMTNDKGEQWPFLTDNGLIILSDDQFKDWKHGDLDVTDDDMIVKHAFEAATPSTSAESMFKVSEYEDANDDVEFAFEQMFQTFFELIPGETLKRPLITQTIYEHMNRGFTCMRMAGIDRDPTQSRTSISNFLRWLSKREGVCAKIEKDGSTVYQNIRIRKDTSLKANEFKGPKEKTDLPDLKDDEDVTSLF